jgi:RNA-directed DNA polymerase
MSLHREGTTRETQFGWIAQKARENPAKVFTSLAHHLTEQHLLSSFRRLRKGASSGLDKISWYDYEQGLMERISDLHHWLRTQKYRAPDIRRVWIDKDGGKKRALGISNIEDKIVQRAVTDILSPIYEQDFYGHSSGFRPKRSAH